MPLTNLVFFLDEDGVAPVHNWLQALQRSNRRAFAKCVARIQRLAELGHELRRPEADLLRDGIHELRTKYGHVQYRVLYFFQNRTEAVLVHALTKKDAVPIVEIDRAVRRMELFRRNPAKHTFVEEEVDDEEDPERDQDDRSNGG